MTIAPRITLPGLESGWVGLHVCAVLLVIGLIWRLYRQERQLIPPATGRLLLGLRFTALLVVLLVLLQPTWAWVVVRKQVGRLVIAVDGSDSMQMSDPQATTAERLRWAAALGWIEPHPGRLAARFETAVAAAGPAVVPEGLDAETWQDLSAQLEAKSRLDLARESLMSGPEPVWQRLQAIGQSTLQLFAGVPVTLTPDMLQQVSGKERATLQPEATRMASVLKTVDPGSPEAPVLGVVILTDGRDADAAQAIALARACGQNGVPVYPVLVGSTQRPKDLSIISVDVPPAVYRDDHPRFKVLISTSGYEGQELTVRFGPREPDERYPEQTRTITTADGPQLVEFEVVAGELGDHPFRVSLPEWEGETRADNNHRDVVLRVVDDRSRVLLVDSEPRWEFRYLEIALARDPRIETRAVLFDQPYLGILPAPFFNRTWPPPQNDGTVPGVTDRDLIIVGDVSASQLTDQRWVELERFVAEQGGVLVLIAGRTSLPLQIAAESFRTLLPITNPRLSVASARAAASPPNRGWSWSLSREGDQQAFLQLAGDHAANRAIWDLLPGAGWAIDGVPKPGATVWAYGRDEATQTAVPLIVHQYVGLGQVIWLATDSTWRWRFRSADEFHHRFWGQLARFAAESKLSSGNEFVQFGPVRPAFPAGEPVELQARWSSRFLQQAGERQAAFAEIRRNGETVARVPLEAHPQRPLISNGQVSSLPAGTYTARLVAPQLAANLPPLQAEFTVEAPLTAELAELSANPVLLQELAAASGGKLLHLDELRQLPELLQPITTTSSLPQEQTLWDRWPTFLVLAGLLTVEWLVRRQHGLP